MEAFSYHQEALVLLQNSGFVQKTSNMFGLLEERAIGTTTTTSFSPIYPNPYPQETTSLHVDHHIVNESGSSLDTSHFTNVEPLVTLQLHHTDSSSMVAEIQKSDQITQMVMTQMEKKSKNTHSKVGKCKKNQKICDDGMSRKREKKRLRGDKNEKKKMTNINDQVESSYVHVRARRGQATDNHSLAERERRKKISERMVFLQSLVPGCDEVSGKALILDEIINYVESLQNQVEFLLTKLAPLNPKFNDFEAMLDTEKPATEEFCCLEPLLPSLSQSDPSQLWPVTEITPTSTFFHLQHDYRSIVFSEGYGDPV